MVAISVRERLQFVGERRGGLLFSLCVAGGLLVPSLTPRSGVFPTGQGLFGDVVPLLFPSRRGRSVPWLADLLPGGPGVSEPSLGEGGGSGAHFEAGAFSLAGAGSLSRESLRAELVEESEDVEQERCFRVREVTPRRCAEQQRGAAL